MRVRLTENQGSLGGVAWIQSPVWALMQKSNDPYPYIPDQGSTAAVHAATDAPVKVNTATYIPEGTPQKRRENAIQKVRRTKQTVLVFRTRAV